MLRLGLHHPICAASPRRRAAAQPRAAQRANPAPTSIMVNVPAPARAASSAAASTSSHSKYSSSNAGNATVPAAGAERQYAGSISACVRTPR